MTRTMKTSELYIIVFGVSGCGKTLIGKLLAEKLDISFIEGDDLHPVKNITKMKNGDHLTDADRMPWLAFIEKEIKARIDAKKGFVLSCSALKVNYRTILRKAGKVRFLFLNVDEKKLQQRLLNRKGHFMPASLLDSQMNTLELPQPNESDILFLDAGQSPEKIITDILNAIL